MKLMERFGTFHGSCDDFIQSLFDDLQEKIAEGVRPELVTEDSRMPWLALAFGLEAEGGVVWSLTLVGRNGIGNTLHRGGDRILIVCQEILCSFKEWEMFEDVRGRVGDHRQRKAQKFLLSRGERIRRVGCATKRGRSTFRRFPIRCPRGDENHHWLEEEK
jgi:hypothetical protein